MKLWKWIPAALNQESVKSASEGAKQVFELAKVLKENKKDVNLAPLVGQISSLLDVLNSPLGQFVKESVPFLPIATGIIGFVIKQTQTELDLAECVALICQVAYLESLRELKFMPPEEREDLIKRLNDRPASAEVTNQLEQIGNKLELKGREIEFDRDKAKQTLFSFHDSELAQIFNSILSQRLIDGGLKEAAAKVLTERVARYAHRYFKESVGEIKDKIPALASIYGAGWEEEERRHHSIDRYLTEVIAAKPNEKVFDEDFSFADIYVSLEVQDVKNDGHLNENTRPQPIERWAVELLKDGDKKRQVLFLQGAPGRGKSVFCRLFADWVRRELYPMYIPILIRLRDIDNFDNDFDRTLAAAVGRDFVTSDNGWLTDRHSRFLFILDGFDELILERGGHDRTLQDFLKQVGNFQEKCANNSERNHRVLITGRPLSLLGFERFMPDNLDRVEIVPMSGEIKDLWLQKWGRIADKSLDIAQGEEREFRAFLDSNNCPSEVRKLVAEPLLMYMLAAMHRLRDGKRAIDIAKFQQTNEKSAKIAIYEESLQWVLTKQRGKDLNTQLTKLEPDDLEIILTRAALCVVQSGREYASLEMIKEYLPPDIAQELDQIQKSAPDTEALKNALCVFYLKSSPGMNNHVEFFHKSFSEFLFAKYVVDCCQEWTAKTASRRQNYLVEDANFESQIYNLLGYGHLTLEIVEYIHAQWQKQTRLDFIALFDRLQDFYLSWCQGKFIEKADATTLPQTKALALQKYNIETGQRTVDIYTGLNVLILLLELNRYAQTDDDLTDKLKLYPCGEPNTAAFESERLLKILNYVNVLGIGTVNQSLGKFFSSADLSDANLSDANLSDANLSDANLSDANLSDAYLSDANLSGADLRGANLSGANLSGAYLSGANLSRADLSGADLSGAYLSGANLSGAYLRGANLSGAYLSGADLSRADLEQIKWNSSTKWQGAVNLHVAKNIPPEWIG
jgi:hypothetical protein